MIHKRCLIDDAQKNSSSGSLQVGKLRTRLLEDRKISVSLCPEGEELFILIPAPGRLFLQSVGSRKAKMREDGSGHCGVFECGIRDQLFEIRFGLLA